MFWMKDSLPGQNSLKVRRFRRILNQATVYDNLIEAGLRKDIAYWLASRWPSEQTFNDIYWITVIVAIVLGMAR